MFLTTAEATWIGASIVGVFSWLNARATRSREHHQRIWDRTADLYEHVLFEAASWAATRDKLMCTYELARPGREIPTLDDAERQRTLIRLELFGHHEVQDAFERYAKAHWTWAGCHQALQDAYDQNRQVTAGQMIAHEWISQEEINRKQAERKTANRIANEQHSELRHVTQGAARREPKPDRWFRRAPRAVLRGARSARRYLEATPDERQRRRQLQDR